MKEIKNHWTKWAYWFSLCVATIIVYKALDNFGDLLNSVKKLIEIVSPFLAGIFVAYLLYMPCRNIEKTYKKAKLKLVNKKARSLSIATVYIVVLVLIIILINVIMPVVIESVTDLINNIEGYVDIAVSKYNELPEDSIFKGEIVQEAIQSAQEINIKQYFNTDKIIEYAKGAVDAVSSIFNIFVTVIVSIYILVERAEILNFLKKCASALFEDKTYKNLDKYFNHSNEIFFKFIASQFLDAIVVGIMVTIAMTILKIKFAPLLGFMIGLFNMIPYFGAIIAIGIAALITLITGGISQTIWMLIVVIILQQIDSNIINPKIVGKSLKISPLLVIFAVAVGGAYFGVLGMFLAVPVIAVVKILVEDYIEMKLNSKKIKEGKN